MKGRTANKEEKRHLDRVCALGCIVCLEFMELESPAEPHHLDGKTKPGAHKRAIGLCPPHHRIPGDGYATRHGPGRRAGQAIFEQTYATEEWLLIRVNERLGIAA
jgi:hypothetical protein